MEWLDEYPELAKYVTQLSNSTNMSRKDWAEFMDELRVVLEKPQYVDGVWDAYKSMFDDQMPDLDDVRGQHKFSFTFGDTK